MSRAGYEPLRDHRRHVRAMSIWAWWQGWKHNGRKVMLDFCTVGPDVDPPWFRLREEV